MAIWSYVRGGDTIDIKTGYSCNNRCLHCVVEPVRSKIVLDGEKQDLTTDEVVAHIDQAAGGGAKAVVLTGGEVTLRHDFLHLVRHAASCGLGVIVQTNGRRLSAPEHCEALRSVPDMLFVVALHAPRAELHDRITKRRNSFDETVAAIRNLCCIDKEVAAKIVLSRLNADEVLATARFARSLGVNEFCVVFPHALDFPDEQFREVVPRYRDLREQLSATCRYAEAEGLPVTFETVPYCVMGNDPGLWRRSCDLQSKVQQRPATGDTRVFGDRFEWDELRPTMKAKSDSCSTCVFDRLCEGPWSEYVAAFGHSEFVPVLPADVASFLEG